MSKEHMEEENIQNTTIASARVKIEEVLDHSFQSIYAFDVNTSFKAENEIKEESYEELESSLSESSSISSPS